MTGTPASDQPKYRQIEQFLLEEIQRGNYRPGRALVTEREICHTFGVSRVTAVRALNDLVKQGVLERRRGAGTFVRGKGIQTSVGGHGLLLLGCVFPNVRGHHQHEILAGVDEVCRESEASMILYDSAARPDWELQNLRRAQATGVSGVIVYAVDGLGSMSELSRARLPMVMVDRHYPALVTDAVVPDSFMNARRVVNMLVDRGHRRLAVAWGEVACTTVLESYAGVRRALLERGLPLEPDLFQLTPYHSLPECARHARLRAWLHADQPPTAFVAVNVHTLLTLRTDLSALGVDSDAVALASLSDDYPAAREAIGAISVELPSRRMGVIAARLLLGRLAGTVRGPARHIVLDAAAPEADTSLGVTAHE